MPKFHDEFFNKGSSKHDDLVVWCIGEVGKKKIIKKLKETMPKNFASVGDVFVQGSCSRMKDIKPKGIPFTTENFCGFCSYKGFRDYCKLVCQESPVAEIIPDIKKEVEVICSSGSFIIGYADIVFHYSEEYILEDGKKVYMDNLDSYFKVVVEVKPEIKEIGSVLRQLKTYMNILSDIDFGLIVTYSDIPQEKIDLLKGEDIFVISEVK